MAHRHADPLAPGNSLALAADGTAGMDSSGSEWHRSPVAGDFRFVRRDGGGVGDIRIHVPHLARIGLQIVKLPLVEPVEVNQFVPLGAHALLMADGIFRPASPVLYPTLVRGYDVNSFEADDCTDTIDGTCPEFDRMISDFVGELPRLAKPGFKK